MDLFKSYNLKISDLRAKGLDAYQFCYVMLFDLLLIPVKSFCTLAQHNLNYSSETEIILLEPWREKKTVFINISVQGDFFLFS